MCSRKNWIHSKDKLILDIGFRDVCKYYLGFVKYLSLKEEEEEKNVRHHHMIPLTHIK